MRRTLSLAVTAACILAAQLTIILSACSVGSLSQNNSGGSLTDTNGVSGTNGYVFGDLFYTYSSRTSIAKNESYIDTVFHTTIRRVTDSKSDRNEWGTGAGYSTWDPQSSDGQYLLFMKHGSRTTAGGYVVYHAGTLAFVKDVSSTLQWWNGQDPEPRWDKSGGHPSWLYYRKDKQLRYYDISDDSDHLVRDFSSDFTDCDAGYYIYNGEEGTPSDDTRYWVFMVRNANTPYNTKYVFVYDRNGNTLVAAKTVTNTPNSVTMSKSGNYVYVAWDWDGTGSEFDGPHAYNRTFSSNVKICSGIPHAVPAYDKQGREVMFFMDGDYVSFTRMDNGQRYDLYYQGDMGWDGSNLLHAAPGYGKRGWGLVSTYSDGTNGNNHWADNQLFMVELDENKTYGSANLPRIWRLSFSQNSVDPVDYYYQQPNAQINSEGTKIWWGANWRNVNGTNEIYQMDLPASWYSDLN